MKPSFEAKVCRDLGVGMGTALLGTEFLDLLNYSSTAVNLLGGAGLVALAFFLVKYIKFFYGGNKNENA